MSIQAYRFAETINAPVDTVWDLLADGASWADWSFIPKSTLESPGSPDPDGVGAVRKLGLWPVVSRERVTAFEPGERFAYESVRGLPVKSYEAEVELVARGDKTELVWTGVFEPKFGFGHAAVAAYLRGAVRRILNGLSAEAERRAVQKSTTTT
jgi:hypothetical protein